MANIHDVAAYIVDYFDTGISTMKLQKLAFFSQGWSLTLLEEPLFDEEFEAWANGPVSYDLFDRHRGDFSVRSWPSGRISALSGQQKIVIDAVLKNFGALSGRELSELTHQPGTPWEVTRRAAGASARARSNAVIDINVMREFFDRTLT
ncbi:Panacea domain-containing protein [Arthrobacter sp. MDT1-65]